jgi:hypothetical protein
LEVPSPPLSFACIACHARGGPLPPYLTRAKTIRTPFLDLVASEASPLGRASPPPWFLLLLPLTVSKRYLPWLFRLHRVSSPSSLRFRLPSALRIAMTEVLVHNRQLLLLLRLLHRTIFLACCLFATGTLGAVFLVAGLQRSSELRGSQLRSSLSLGTTRNRDQREESELGHPSFVSVCLPCVSCPRMIIRTPLSPDHSRRTPIYDEISAASRRTRPKRNVLGHPCVVLGNISILSCLVFAPRVSSWLVWFSTYRDRSRSPWQVTDLSMCPSVSPREINTNNRDLYPSSVFGLHRVCVHARPLEERIRTDPSSL